MSQAKQARERKRQLGQFLTPEPIARALVARLPLTSQVLILEPSFGDGAFLVPLVERLIQLHEGSPAERLARVYERNLFGVELDPQLYDQALLRLTDAFGPLPEKHHLQCGDFFRSSFAAESFDLVVGNPPFGGTIDPALQDALDRELGMRNGLKIKKETYAFFIIRSLDLLEPNGRLVFVCSDTFLSINTMRGLREYLMTTGATIVELLPGSFDETNHPMVVLDHQMALPPRVRVFEQPLALEAIRSTGNSSWLLSTALEPYFRGPKLGDFFVASSGMTIGRNELFLREIVDGVIEEPWEFTFFEEPITLERERERARLGQLSPAKVAEIEAKEAAHATRRNVRWTPRDTPQRITLPHPDYRPYNKASSQILYAPPTHAIYWKDEGDAVLTFKKNGNWYLHGVGGGPYFGREGLTWPLIAPRYHARFLPPGCILDSGAPCAFLREGTPREELFFVLGWLLTDLCTRLQKDVLNHTRNIQSKDFERLPYPFWVAPETKSAAIQLVEQLLDRAQKGTPPMPEDIRNLMALYEPRSILL